MKRVRVGDVLRLKRRPVAVDPTAEYVSIGVRSFGKGIFHYPPTTGAELGKLRFFEIHPAELVVSNIKAWESAIAVSSAADAATIGSNRFLTYEPIDGAIDVRYACYFFLSEAGLPLIQRASPGSADRNRTLAIDRFENLAIPLPGIAEQQRLVARLESALGATRLAAEQSERASRLDRALTDSLVDAIVTGSAEQGWPEVPLGDVATVNPRPARVEGLVAFVPMSAVDQNLGRIASPELRSVSEARSGYRQFRRGDVIFARITPCMQNGKSALADLDGVEYGYGSTEFHVLRPSEGVLARWLHHVVRSRGFRERALGAFTGTAGQQRVPAEFMRSAQIPVPPLAVQRTLVARLDRIVRLGDELRKRREKQSDLAKALHQSILNHTFAPAA
ncbi:MAG: restriction endonuclease subunit S [Thermoleophilia bacterium]|nr:restriction endonuclease subunit S [Thermoleophilia bacterium]